MSNWEDMVVLNSIPLRSAMEVIDKTGLQTALITSLEGIFLGTLTDGDIRRAILSGANLSNSIDPFVNRHPVTISSFDEIKTANEAMERLALRCIPVVAAGKILGLIRQNQTLPVHQYDNPVLIMAGGRGERLKPLTNTTPKPLMKVGGKTILEILLERLSACGFSNIWISVHYLSEQIESLIGTGEQFGLRVSYIKETSPLGTAGAYLNLPEDTSRMSTIIVNADLVTNVDFSELLSSHSKSAASVTIGVIEHLTEIPFGVVETLDGKVTSIVEKPTLSNLIYAGVGVYEQSSFAGFTKGNPVNATDVYAKLLDSNKEISIFEISGYWRDIGTGESLQSAHKDLGIGQQ